MLALLLAAVTALEINGTFLDPDFYPQELREANIYEFALVDVTTTALEEGRTLTPEDLGTAKLDENPLVTIGLTTEEIVSSLNRAIPPEWVQSVVEQLFDGIGQYIAGRRDEFTVSIRAGDQVVAMVSEIKPLLRKADAYNLLFAELIHPAIEDSLAEKMPLGLKVSSDRLAESARKVISPEWVQAEVEDALDEITPYVVGERDGFEIKVELSDRVEVALVEVKGLLRDVNAYDLLYDEVIQPAIVGSLAGAGGLPAGIVLSNEEVTSALRQVAPPGWVQDQAERIIDEAGPYLTGTADTLSVDISLVENKRDARSVIAELARRKFREAVDGLPPCGSDLESANVILGGLDAVPQCMPLGDPAGQTEDFLIRIENSIANSVATRVVGAIPNTITFTDTALRQTLVRAGASENIDLLDDLRKIIGKGRTYTELDLRQDISEVWGDNGVERLDDARDFLTDEWSYTKADFRADIVEVGDAGTLRDFDRGRDGLKWAKRLRLLIYVPVVLVLVVIGFLRGRSWSHRIGWSAAFLVATSALIFIAAGPVYGTSIEPRLDSNWNDALADIDFNGAFPITESLVREKILEMAESIADDIASGIAVKSLILLAIGLLALAVAIGWRVVASRRRY